MSRVYEEVDTAYAAVCSDATLCSDPKGFFKEFANEIVSMSKEKSWLSNTFGKAGSVSEKLKCLLQNEEVSNAINEVLSRVVGLNRGKDARESYERRLAASKALSVGDLVKALALASQAVLRAPMPEENDAIDNGVSLALALWMRSEILLKMEKPALALEDLKLALKERLPAKMRALYYWRMGTCYKGTGEITRAKVSYELADRLVNDEGTHKKLQDDILSLKDLPPIVEPPKPEIQEDGLTGGAKTNVPSLSNLVNITEEENKGRFAASKSDIKAGDVLLIESPYAACLLPDCFGTHCLHCFKRLEAPVWCTKCSGVAFCSVPCRDEALRTYHKIECKFVDLFIGSGMSILSHIALRMITQAGLETSLSIHSKYISNELKTVDALVVNDIEGISKKSRGKSRKEKLNRNKRASRDTTTNKCNEKAESDDKLGGEISFKEKLELTAGQIYSLCVHNSQRSHEDYQKRIVMAMFLTECLKKAGFFSSDDSYESKMKHINEITELICKNLQLLQFNAHEIYETVRGAHKFSGARSRYIAVGIYPTGALFNHECYPAVARYFQGKKIILRAVRSLAPGEVVAENYGPHFLMKGREERRRALACRYWFTCQCSACTENWPNLKQLKEEKLVYIRCANNTCTQKFKGDLKTYPSKCPKCSSPIKKDEIRARFDQVEICMQKYQMGAKLMEEEKPREAIALLCEGINNFSKCGAAPHLETHVAQEALRSCFADSGNIYVTPNIDS